MNSLVSLLKSDSTQTQNLCPIHLEPMLSLANHLVCNTCAKEHFEKSQKAHHAEVQQNLMQKRIKNSGLPERHLQCGFKNYVCDHLAQVEALEKCQNFAHQIMNGKTPNLIMYGYCGTGKTHLSASILRNILHKSVLSARYYTSAQIAQKLMDTWSDTTKSEDEVIQQLTSFELLVIDEYGLHDRHEKRQEMIHKVLYSRYDRLKSSLIISNFDLKTLQKDLGVRLWSRLHENELFLVPCYWNDQRLA